MEELFPNELARFATELAVEAGATAMTEFGVSAAHRKTDGTEVTEADLAIQGRIIQSVGERYADHHVIGEERVPGGGARGAGCTSRYCWVVDPVDGTRNYARRFPAFATSIAVLEQGRPIVGVVRWHHTAQLFVATSRATTTVDGLETAASQRPVDADLLVGAQLGPSHGTQNVVAPWLDRWAVRNLGATALHLALVAAGGLDAAYARDCRIWDLAAGALLIERAGGKCTGLHGEALFPVDPTTCADANYPFIAGGPNAHARLMQEQGPRTDPH